MKNAWLKWIDISKGTEVFAFFILLSFGYAPSTHSAAVATATALSTQAAVEILKQGGNAVDATVAASFVMNVTQPFNMGIGGGGFMLVSKLEKVSFIDSRETAPASAHEKMFLDSTGNPIPYFLERVTGPNPVGVPGTVKGLFEAHKKFGKLPWAMLLQPAIQLARNGHPINLDFERALADSWGRISSFSATAATFSDGRGSYLRHGQILKWPSLAMTFEKIARNGNEFYEGELADSWLSDARTLGVKITKNDLSAYTLSEPKPVHFKLFGLWGYAANLPSASGLMVVGTLRFLENYYKNHALPTAKSAARVVVTTEAIKYFQKLRNQTIADIGYSKLEPQKFLESQSEKLAWKVIERNIRARLKFISNGVSVLNEMAPDMESSEVKERPHDHTTHLSVVDDHGMAVSYTTTIEQWFGSGLLVPTNGFLLNNELSDFDASPGHPNSPAAAKRPRSNMSPLLFYESNQPSAPLVGVVGCAGGHYIPTALIVFLENYYLFKMNALDATAFPRFHPEEDTIETEKLPESTYRALRMAKYKLDLSGGAWSSLQAIMRKNSKKSWEVAAEPRGESSGVVW